MGNPDVERAADHAFRAELKSYQDRLDLEERRRESIAESAKYLMEPGKECDPWNFENLAEALGNAPEAELKVMWALIAEAYQHGCRDNDRNHMAVVSICQLVMRYWREVSLFLAEKNYQ